MLTMMLDGLRSFSQPNEIVRTTCRYSSPQVLIRDTVTETDQLH